MAAATREHLLEAAVRVVTRDGIGSMTLDAVAREAGVSKGGLIHHFASKDALVAAMIEYFADNMLRSLDRLAADDPRQHGRRVRAMIRLAFPGIAAAAAEADAGADLGAGPDSPMQRMFLACVTAAATNPKLLEPARAHADAMAAKLLGQYEDGLWQLALWLALDGLMLWRVLGLLPEGDPLERRMVHLLYQLSGQPPAAALAASSSAAAAMAEALASALGKAEIPKSAEAPA